MKIQRYGGMVGIALAGALVLAACGTDNNTGSTTSGTGSASGGTSPSVADISCVSGTLNAAGSTAQGNAITAWKNAYQQKCGSATINYNANGSGAGVTSFTQNQVDFAGSDYPLNAQQKAAATRCTNNSALDIPVVPGAIAVGYNVPGVSGQLKLSAATLAQIFTGKITNWNDQAIAKDNPGVTLPSLPIQPFYRSDTSGTSFNFSNYLSHDAASDWTTGANKQWPSGHGQGENGSSAVAHQVQATQGGIGYFELSYAQQGGISYAAVGDAAGNFVSPTTDTATAFLADATVTGTGNDLALTFDYSAANAGAGKYPAVLVTYEIVCGTGNDPKQLPLLKSFLSYITSSAGQAALPAAGYVQLPAAIQAKDTAVIAGLA